MRYRALWINEEGAPEVLDQTALPFAHKTITLKNSADAVHAIASMQVRGAGTIGSVAAIGIWLAARESLNSSDPDATLQHLAATIREARPTAVNLMWAVDRMLSHLQSLPSAEWVEAARTEAIAISDEDAERTAAIGCHGAELIAAIHRRHPDRPVEILTHCNAGWLGIIDSGTALSPIYEAQRQGIPVHVWVDETRPRNQGALTAYELGEAGVNHTLIADNAGGYLMQEGRVDLIFVGADRVSRSGDVANKIGTYLKALAAADNGVPFYVALPVTTFDFACLNGREIPVELRSEQELLEISGLNSNGELTSVRPFPAASRGLNPAFDITPARLITGLITERGICEASCEAIEKNFADRIEEYA